MKKKVLILLSIVAMLALTSCSSETIKTSKKNTIYDVELSQKEQDILDLVGENSDIDIYEYKVDDDFKELNIWLEVYKDGELLSRANEFSTEIDKGRGRIAVRVEGENHEVWAINHREEGSATSTFFELDEELTNDIDSFASNGNLDQTIKISEDKEIVLKKYLFTGDDSFNVYDNQYYADNPSVIKDYPYVYLLKCKIVKDER